MAPAGSSTIPRTTHRHGSDTPRQAASGSRRRPRLGRGQLHLVVPCASARVEQTSEPPGRRRTPPGRRRRCPSGLPTATLPVSFVRSPRPARRASRPRMIGAPAGCPGETAAARSQRRPADGIEGRRAAGLPRPGVSPESPSGVGICQGAHIVRAPTDLDALYRAAQTRPVDRSAEPRAPAGSMGAEGSRGVNISQLDAVLRRGTDHGPRPLTVTGSTGSIRELRGDEPPGGASAS